MSESGSTRSRPWLTVSAGVALFLLSAVQQWPSAFRYDAAVYWSGSVALFTGDSTYDRGWLELRGFLTPFVYAPAALVERLFAGAGGPAVLVENALLVAVAGVVLLPGIARTVGGPRTQGPLVTWLCAGLSWLVLGRFAPYPLMDLPAVVLFLTVLRLALVRSRWGVLVLAGVAAGVTVNLRPAYLIPVGAVVVGVVVLHRSRAVLFLVGAVLGSLPQVVFNVARGAAPSLMPAGTPGLMSLQASYASYVVRYDTIIDTSGPPQQFYCDPSMAHAVAGHPVTSTGQLAKALLTNLPESVAFMLKKVGAALAWSSSTPYSTAAAVERYDLALPIVLITVIGAFGLVLAARRREGLLLAGSGLAVCLSLMTSATETRFALPLVLLGIVGCAVTVGLPATRLRSTRLLVAAAAVVVLGLAFAAWGVADALPPGPAGAAQCATVR
ncbi:hypothetical protein HC028_03250 [Planosporangium flavigriseum]|nr:hypothetical protein [Planosporangium flavigriseum]NJC63531.1 hypothetical protein [Planosporangium flavigriseum]